MTNSGGKEPDKGDVCLTCEGRKYILIGAVPGAVRKIECSTCNGTGKHEHRFIPCDEWSATCLCGATE